jgi:hypothetical protein
MTMLRRHSRDRYLNELAAEPFFRGVPRHLIAVVGRSVDRFDLAPGETMRCDFVREVMLVARGNVVVLDARGRAQAAVGSLGMIGGAAPVRAECRIVATAPVNGFVVGRRELAGLASVAPRVAAAMIASEQVGLGDGELRSVKFSAGRSAPVPARASRS